MEGGKSEEEAGPSSVGGDELKGKINEQAEMMSSGKAPDEVSDEDECEDCAFAADQEDGEHQKGNGGLIADFNPGPLLPLRDQIEKDKDDDSLRRWKEKLLGCVETDLSGKMEPEVKFHSISIVTDEFAETTTPLPVDESQSGRVLFTLREGSEYRLKLTFTVLHNIVSGLTYTNTVWKGGIRVDRSKGMLGTFAPQQEPYVHFLDKETTPSGVLARGLYTAKLKFQDDDRRCHMELKYSFEIKKDS